jgi:transposase
MIILAGHPTWNITRPVFRIPPWYDTHPSKLDIEQRLAPGHLARFFENAVGRIDLSKLLAVYRGTGSMAHSPALLLAVLLYEIRSGRHSPSQWRRDANECEPVRWLLRGSIVARSCWYSFRDRVAPLVPNFHEQVLALSLAADLTPATRAADDGTLVAANASRHKVVNLATLEKHSLILVAAVAEDKRQAQPASAGVLCTAAGPVAETASETPALPAWLAASAVGRQQQLKRLEQSRRRLDELHEYNQKKWASKQKKAESIVVSLSDPEAAVGRDKEKVFRPLYNVQVLVDLDSPLILGYRVFAQQNDAGVLGTMLTQARQQLGHRLELVLVDAAYAGGSDLADAQEEGVTVYAPVPGDGVTNPKQIPKREFVWSAAEQKYVCPQGHRLELEESWQEKRAGGSIKVWRYRCSPTHCQGCPLQKRCTSTPASGRAVTRQEHDELIEALRARMAQVESKALYRLRSQNVELVNADFKEHRRLRRFSGRGLLRVNCEVGLTVLAHNLLIVMNADKKQAKEVDARPGAQLT